MAYSDMSSEFDRLTSFITWPRRNECFRTVSLAKAGFYYTGEGDKLRCFSCDGEVSNWREDMLPDEEHRARFPHCRLVRGDETHNRPTARLGNPRPLLMAPQLHAPSLPSPRPSFLDDPGRDRTSLHLDWSTMTIMQSQVAHTVLELGLHHLKVERAARVWAARNDGLMPDANSLAELALNISDGGDRHSSDGYFARTSSMHSVSDVTSSMSQNAVPPEATIGNQRTPKLEATEEELEASRPEEFEYDTKAMALLDKYAELCALRDCILCSSAERNTAFLPCGHITCCSSCAAKQSICPFEDCLSVIADIQRIYP